MDIPFIVWYPSLNIRCLKSQACLYTVYEPGSRKMGLFNMKVHDKITPAHIIKFFELGEFINQSTIDRSTFTSITERELNTEKILKVGESHYGYFNNNLDGKNFWRMVRIEWS